MAAEEAQFIQTDGGKLFGVMHLPDKPKLGLVMCHPFGEERLWCYRLFVNLARDLAQKGVACLRFDYRGQGDSEGDFAQATVSTRVQDTRAALNALSRRLPPLPLALLGLRLGATVAALVADSTPSVSRLCLWMPVVEGKSYLMDSLRHHVTAQMSIRKRVTHNREALRELILAGGEPQVDYEGYPLSRELFQEAQAISLLEGAMPLQAQTLIAAITREGQSRPPKDLAQLNDAWSRAGAQVELVVVHEHPFWNNMRVYVSRSPGLFEVTERFLLGPPQ